MLKNALIRIAALLLVTIAPLAASAADLTLVEAGKSPYRVVIPKDANPRERYAADQLVKYVQELSGAKLPVVDDETPRQPHEIVLSARNRRIEGMKLGLPRDTWGRDGFTLKTVGETVVVAGGQPRGTIYGALELLEMWGVRFFTPDVTHIPKAATLSLSPLDRTVKPSFIVREVSAGDWREFDFVTHLRLTGPVWGSRHTSETHGITATRKLPSHSFKYLLSREDYLKDHPEYFAMSGGKRGLNENLCLTSPEVARIVADNLIDRMEKAEVDPETWSGLYWQVSQMDGTGPCECPKCKALATAGGSYSGPPFLRVNRVAKRVAEQFPKERLLTLAYQYGEVPPKSIRVADNVTVFICTSHADRLHPIALDSPKPKNRYYAETIAGWGARAKHLMIWDYVTDFTDIFNVHPDYFTWAPNLRFYRESGAIGLYMQALPREMGWNGEFYDLRKYVLSRLLWDVTRDPVQEMKAFCNGVYGQHGDLVFSWMEHAYKTALANPRNKTTDFKMNQWNTHNKCGFTVADVDDWLGRFERALADEKNDKTASYLRLAMMPLLFTRITMEEAPKLVKNPDGDGLVPDRPVPPAYAAALQRFREIAEKESIPYIREKRTTVTGFVNRRLAATRDQPALELAKGEGELSVLPGLGGVVRSWTTPNTGNNSILLRYEVTVGTAHRTGPGWSEAYHVQPGAFADGHGTRMVAELENQCDLRRELELLSENSLRVKETLTNRKDEPQKVILNSYFDLRVAGPFDTWGKNADGQWKKLNFRQGVWHAYGPKTIPTTLGGGAWAFRDLRTGTARVFHFDPKRLVLVVPRRNLQFCLRVKPTLLNMNDSLSITYRVETLGKDEADRLFGKDNR